MTERLFDSAILEKLRGSLIIEYTLAKKGANKLRKLLEQNPFVPTLGAYNGQQAVQYAKAGMDAIYVSGWQVAASNNTSGDVYPDQSLYPVNSVPNVVKSINNALRRVDQIQTLENSGNKDFYLPIVADAEAGFGGVLNAYELMLHLIEAGAAGVHFEDQLSSEKKCGHLGGKVLIPTQQMVKMLSAARLAADVANVNTVLIARTDAESATLITSDIDEQDQPFIIRERTVEGFFKFKNGIEACIARALSYAPYVDLIWFETSSPNLATAKQFAESVLPKYPHLKLAYNCSPSFNWRKFLTEKECKNFQIELGKLGYKFQFVTLAAFHSCNLASFELAKGYLENGMLAYSQLQQREFEAQSQGFTTVKHQSEVGVQYFDAISEALGASSTTALQHSTENEQF